MFKGRYKELGTKLREYRKKLDIGIKGVSRSLEINYSYLSKLETGTERPSRDLLNKIIFNYGLQKEQAIELFNLAGYRGGVIAVTNEAEKKQKETPQVEIPVGSQTLYSDVVNITVTPHGFVLNFAQQLGPTNQYVIVSRIGMSKEHVESLIKVLKGLLVKASGKKATRKVPLS